MARTATLRNSKAIASALKNLEQTSTYLSNQLQALGYVEVQKVKGEGRGLVAISKNWGKNDQASMA